MAHKGLLATSGYGVTRLHPARSYGSPPVMDTQCYGCQEPTRHLGLGSHQTTTPLQAGDTIWGKLNKSEDHVVPYTKDTKENTIFTVGDYNKKQKNEDASSVARSTEQTSGTKDQLVGSNAENSSSFNTNEELSAPRLDMDTWPDLPSLNVGLSKGDNGGSDQDSIETALMDDLSQASNQNKVRVQLDSGPERLGNEHDENDGVSFLDCDWANIGDIDDLDRIFRNNESIFGHEMVANVDEFLSPSTDVIVGTERSIPMPDIPLSRDEPSHQVYASFQSAEHPGGKSKTEEQTEDSTVENREGALNQAHLISELWEMQSQLLVKEDRQKTLLKSAEDNGKNKALQNLNGAWPQSIGLSQQFSSQNMCPSVPTSSQTFLFQELSRQRQVGAVEHNPLVLSGYGNPTYAFSAMPLQSRMKWERDQSHQTQRVAVTHKLHSDSLKPTNNLNKLSEVESRSLTMTPQEKIEKLRRRHQMQAMLAIQQQQQQQLGHQISGTDSLVPQASFLKNQSQDAVVSNLKVEESANKFPLSCTDISVKHDVSQRVSTLVDDNSLEETIYYQLQDVLGKLDTRVRLCIRDSLFRLARSAGERQSASARSSTNKSTRDEDEVLENEEINTKKCGMELHRADVETYTNPKDRTVAHLLFHMPPESGAAKDEIPQTPTLCNPLLHDGG